MPREPGQPAGTSAPEPGRPRAEQATASRRQATAPRRGAADPVKALMHRHRELCERAVDPLEIAAGLEAHGVTDRTAARFRHRDVFSLAEEMYARVPRDGDTPARPARPGTDRPAQAPTPGSAPDASPGHRAALFLLPLLPGALCAATAAGLRLTDGRARLAVATAGTLALALALRAVLRHGPLGSRDRARPAPPGTASRTWWLLAYAVLGDGLLGGAVDAGPEGLPTGTPDAPWPVTVAPLLALALACAPAAWCVRLFAVRARRRLAVSRGLEEFATSVRPLLLTTVAGYVGALTAITAVCAAALDEPAAYAQTLTLGTLLLLARLLTVHGFAHAPKVVLTAAAVAEVTALAGVFAGRLPGCGFLSVPVDALVGACGPAGVPALVCGTGALTLLIHATRTLTKASAHARPDRP